jgi:hypothetical protein
MYVLNVHTCMHVLMAAMFIAMSILNTRLRCPQASPSASTYDTRLIFGHSSWTPQACALHNTSTAKIEPIS